MIYDISMKIHPDMPVYKNREEKKPVFETVKTFEHDGVFETNLTFNLHTGTHIDYPLHTIKGGYNSYNHSLEPFLGTAKVIDVTHVKDGITENELIHHDIQENDFIIFKTKNSFSEKFLFDFTYLEKTGARYLVEKKVRGVGIDALGIERDQPNHPTHDTLLSKDIIILEGVRLKEVPEGLYELIMLPLNIDDVEALPVRAILKTL